MLYIPSVRILFKIMRSCAGVVALRKKNFKEIDHEVWWVKELSYLDILEGNEYMENL